MFRTFRRFVFLSFVFAMAGCAGLTFQTAPVTFAHPFFQTNFADLPPNETESAGVPLVFKIPEPNTLFYKGSILLFAQEKEGKAMKFDFNIVRSEEYAPAGDEGDFMQEIVHDIDKGGGRIDEKMTVSPNGAVKKFIKGEHRSELGKFDVATYKRTPTFPDHSVKVGDSWSYEEELSIKIRSFWVKQKKPSEKKIITQATLKGFTTAAGKRVAVILTESQEKSLEEFSFLFKDIQIDVDSKIEEIVYFDYAAGIVVRRLTNTLTNSAVLGTSFSDVGKSQMYFYLEEPKR